MRRRGLTLLEIMLGMLIAFLAVAFLMGMFISATRHQGRARQLSYGTLLAESAMERLLAMRVDDLPTGDQAFPSPFSQYLYSVDVADAGDIDSDGTADELKVVKVTVVSPGGVRTTLVSLRQTAEPLVGVATNTVGDLAILSLTTDDFPVQWNDPLGEMRDFYPPLGGKPGDVAADRNLTVLWAVDTSAGGLRRLSLAPLGSWSSPACPGPGFAPTGLAVDQTAQVLWVSDAKQRALYSYTVGASTWSAPLLPSDGLGLPRDVTVTDDGGTVWVADRDNNCLRAFLTATSSWEPVHYRDSSMAEPEGVAVSGTGDVVYAIDPRNLYRYNRASGTWSSQAVPGKVRTDFPSGMAASSDGSVVWVTTRRGSFWRVDGGALTFAEVWWRGQGFSALWRGLAELVAARG